MNGAKTYPDTTAFLWGRLTSFLNTLRYLQASLRTTGVTRTPTKILVMHFIHYQTIWTRNSVWSKHVTPYITRIIVCTRHNFWSGSTKSDTCSASKCYASTGDQAHLPIAQLAYDAQMEDKEKTRNKQVHYLTFDIEKTLGLPFAKLTTSYISGSFGFITLESTTFCMGIQKMPRLA